MNADTASYNFKIIEENAVPLSAGTNDYSGIVLVVVLMGIVLAILILYTLWFRNHKRRIAQLLVMGLGSEQYIDEMEGVSVFHPFRTMRVEKELENRVVQGSAKGV